MSDPKNTKSRKPWLVKFFIGKIATGKGWERLLFVVALFTVVFLVAFGIAQWTSGGKASPAKTLLDMISTADYYDYIHEADQYGLSDGVRQSSKSQGVGLVVVYVLGMVFFSGFLIASITALVQGFAQKFNAGKIRYRGLRDHILFLGYDDMVIGILNSMNQNDMFDHHRVVIALQGDVAMFRQTEAAKFLSSYREKVIFLQVNLTDEQELEKKLCIHRAAKVYIIGDPALESHDSLNLTSFIKVCHVAERKGAMAQCYVNFSHQSSLTLFQTFGSTDLGNGAAFKSQDTTLYDKYKQFFHPFNFDELWARKVLLNLDGRYNGLEVDMRDVVDETTGAKVRKCITEIPDGFVHVVIYGMSEKAEAFAKELCFLAHYTNFIQNPEARTRITIVDERLEDDMKYFVSRYAEFFKHCRHRFIKFGEEVNVVGTPIKPEDDFLDVEFEFIECNNSDQRFLDLLKQWSNDPRQYLTLVLCYENTIRNNAVGLYLPSFIYEKDLPIFINQKNQGCLGDFLAGSVFSQVCPFGMYDESIDVDESVEVEWAKRLNYFYYSGFQTGYSDTAKIDEQWNGAILSDRWSSIYNATSIPIKYRNVGVQFVYGDKVPAMTEEQLEKLAVVEHNRWNVEKLMMGYRAATPEERRLIAEDLAKGSIALKTQYKQRFVHCDIVPFDLLGSDHKGGSLKEYDKRLCAEYQNIVNCQ